MATKKAGNITTEEGEAALLVGASIIGDYEEVRKLIGEGANVNATVVDAEIMVHLTEALGIENGKEALEPAIAKMAKGGITALQCAVLYRNTEIAGLLIENGALLVDSEDFLTAAADPQKKSNDTPPLLFFAVDGPHVGMARLLIEHGAPVNATDSVGDSPLYWAIDKGHTGMVRLLIANGASVAATRQDGTSALHHAVDTGRIDMVRVLIENGASVNATIKYGNSVLYWAIAKGLTAIVRLLFEKGATLNKADITVICLRVQIMPDTEMVRLLIQNAGDERLGLGIQLIYDASRTGRAEVVRVLIENGVSANAYTGGSTCLHIAARMSKDKRYTRIVYPEEYYIEDDDDEEEDDYDEEEEYEMEPQPSLPSSPCLEGGTSNGGDFVEVARILIEAGASVTWADSSGDTILHAAVSICGSVEMARFLIENGASVTAKNNGGRTPFHRSVIGGGCSIELARLFIENGAPLTAEDNDGSTVLDYVVASYDSVEMARLLIENGASVTATNNVGNTPLHSCLKYRGSVEMVRVLIENGASVTAKNNRGRDIFHMVYSPLPIGWNTAEEEEKGTTVLVESCLLLMGVLATQGWWTTAAPQARYRLSSRTGGYHPPWGWFKDEWAWRVTSLKEGGTAGDDGSSEEEGGGGGERVGGGGGGGGRGIGRLMGRARTLRAGMAMARVARQQDLLRGVGGGNAESKIVGEEEEKGGGGGGGGGIRPLLGRRRVREEV